MFVAGKNCPVKLIYLFNRLRAKRLIGLLSVPRTFLSQFIKHIEDPPECLQFFFSCMHVSVFIIQLTDPSTSFRMTVRHKVNNYIKNSYL